MPIVQHDYMIEELSADTGDDSPMISLHEVLHPLPNGRRAMSQTRRMGAAAHEVLDDLVQGLPKRVSSPAERLKGARSKPFAQHRGKLAVRVWAG
jgi:hypothetical protein